MEVSDGWDSGLEDEKMNKRMENILDNNKKDTGGEGHDVKDIPNEKPPSGNNPVGMMGGELMDFTQMLENMDEIQSSIDTYATEDDGLMYDNIGDSDNAPAPTTMGIGNGDDELLNQLNKIFTPILVMQQFEGDVVDRIHEACSEHNILVEQNIIKFDDATRMAQLVSVSALLIARQKNTQQYQMYKKAAEIRNSMKIEIQKQEYAAAQALAQKFLVKISTTGGSEVARKSARDLLPETQH